MRAKSGTKEDFSGKSGVFKVTFKQIEEDVMTGKEDYPPSLRVTFDVVGEESTVSLGVPISDPYPVEPFAGGKPPTDEPALRQFIASGVEGEFTVRVWNNFIQEVLAPAGTWLFTDLLQVRPFTRKSDGARRLSFTIAREDGAVTSWTCRDPELVCEKGQTPKEDHIGDERELNPSQTAFQHLVDLGLDWERFKDELEDMDQFPALWPGHESLDGPVESMFGDLENPWKTFPEIVGRHGPRPVEVTVNEHPQYGLGPERTGQFPIAKLTPVIVQGSDGFSAEKEYMQELWNNLASIILQRTTRFVTGAGKLTDDGLTLAKGLIIPVVSEWPGIVKGQKPDGSPAIVFPVEAEDWHTDGLACLSFVAERLMVLPLEELLEPTGVAALADNGKIVAWCRENVPELAGDLEMAEKEVL